MKSGVKRWGRIGAVVEILGVLDSRSAEQVMAAAGVEKRNLPGLAHPLYDLNQVREVAEKSTRPATLRRQPVGV